jgi:hypothetical protein
MQAQAFFDHRLKIRELLGFLERDYVGGSAFLDGLVELLSKLRRVSHVAACVQPTSRPTFCMVAGDFIN